MLKHKLLAFVFLTFLCKPVMGCDCHKHAAAKGMQSAQDFVVSIYSQVFVQEHRSPHAKPSYAPLVSYFHKDLRVNYNKVKQDAPKGASGCLTFNPFTYAQDIFNGFFVERIPGQADAFRVSFFLDDINRAASSVVIKVLQEGHHWKITDIVYDKGSLGEHLSQCLKK